MLISIDYLTCSLSSGLLGWRGVGPNDVGQLDTVLAALAAVMVGTDRGRIHPLIMAERKVEQARVNREALLRMANDVRHLNRLLATR